jgi:hypothetical protein
MFRRTLEVIGGVPPLRLRFSMLNHKYLISAFSKRGHPLRRLLAVLSGLNSTKMIREFGMVDDYVWNQSAQFTITRLEALEELTSVEKNFYQMVVRPLVASTTSPSIYFTDGSKGGAGTGFGVYTILVVPSPAFVFGNQVECLLRRCQRFLWL